MFDITKVNWKKVGIFASGVLFGTAGIKALSSKMLRTCTQIVQQQFFAQKTVL